MEMRKRFGPWTRVFPSRNELFVDALLVPAAHADENDGKNHHEGGKAPGDVEKHLVRRGDAEGSGAVSRPWFSSKKSTVESFPGNGHVEDTRTVADDREKYAPKAPSRAQMSE